MEHETNVIAIVSVKCCYSQISKSENYIRYYCWSYLSPKDTISGYIFINNKRITLNKLIKHIFDSMHSDGPKPIAAEAIYIVVNDGADVFVHLKNFKSICNKFKITSGCLLQTKHPLAIDFSDLNKHKIKIKAFVYDLLLLLPANIGIKHPDVVSINNSKQWKIINCDCSEITNPELTENISDTQLIASYFKWFANFSQTAANSPHPSQTIGSLSEKIFIEQLRANGLNTQYIFGLEEHKNQFYDENKLRYVAYETTIPNLFRDMNQKFPEESFHGGRNESIYYGITPDDVWIDWDIIGAYTTALSFLRPLLYSQAYHSTIISDYDFKQLGYAYLDFKFPRDCLFPCLPVRTANGLIFPLEGSTYATSPEIHLAAKMGAYIQIKDGIILPCDTNHGYPFMDFVKLIYEKRNNPDYIELESKLWKQIGNSLYGKIAQGAKLKRAYDIRTSGSKIIMPSKISNCYFASYITGYIRAMITEIVNILPKEKKIISITTDGFISNATAEEIFIATKGDLARYFGIFSKEISGCESILKEKHRVSSVLSWRTRGQATIKKIIGYDDIILSKSGIQTNLPSKAEQNSFIVDLFKNRDNSTKHCVTFTKPLSQTIKEGTDLTTVTKNIRVNMDYDFKRFPIKIIGNNSKSINSICFETRPVANIEMHDFFTTAAHKYQAFNCNFMTSKESFRQFYTYTKLKSDGDITLTISEFLKAYTHGHLGLERKYTYKELAKILTDNGYTCSEMQFKNSKRSKKPFRNNFIARTQENFKFIQFVNQHFDGFDENKFFVIDNN